MTETQSTVGASEWFHKNVQTHQGWLEQINATQEQDCMAVFKSLYFPNENKEKKKTALLVCCVNRSANA